MGNLTDSEWNKIIECAGNDGGAERTAEIAADACAGHCDSFSEVQAMRHFVADAYRNPRKYLDAETVGDEIYWAVVNAAKQIDKTAMGLIVTAPFWGDLGAIDFDIVADVCSEVARVRISPAGKTPRKSGNGATWKDLKLRSRRRHA